MLRGIDLDVEDGELVVLVGSSGCGKSTLLRTIAGLEIPTSGEVSIGDRDVTKLAPRDRDVAMVFQSYALYPHLRVRDNLSFGLKLKKTDAAIIDARVKEVSQMLGLEALLDRFPRELSGGQRQRVAMGRAIARRPSLFLFDEPLSNLDAALRAEVRVEIKRLHAELAATMVYVTHDQVEAMTLADRLVILNDGKLEQQGPPLELYDHPDSKFVATFMGSPAMNIFPATATDSSLRADGFTLPYEGPARGDVLIGLRPQDLVADEEGPITLTVDVMEAMGFEAYAHGRVGTLPFVARLDGQTRGITRGDAIRFSLPAARLHVFDRQTERAIR